MKSLDTQKPYFLFILAITTPAAETVLAILVDTSFRTTGKWNMLLTPNLFLQLLVPTMALRIQQCQHSKPDQRMNPRTNNPTRIVFLKFRSLMSATKQLHNLQGKGKTCCYSLKSGKEHSQCSTLVRYYRC